MDLYDACVFDLVNMGGKKGLGERMAMTIVKHTLQAIQYLWEHGLKHGDIKPDNIMLTTSNRTAIYEKMKNDGKSNKYSTEERYCRALIKMKTQPSDCTFVLGDFGFCNEIGHGGCPGTLMLKAPEIGNRKQRQDRADLWSTFGTLMYIDNVDNFQDLYGKGNGSLAVEDNKLIALEKKRRNREEERNNDSKKEEERRKEEAQDELQKGREARDEEARRARNPAGKKGERRMIERERDRERERTEAREREINRERERTEAREMEIGRLIEEEKDELEMRKVIKKIKEKEDSTLAVS